jgi:Nucleotide modification associated domain 2
LATCKPRIRKHTSIGDYILGTGSKKRDQHGRVVYLMRVGAITTFDKYWAGRQYARKKSLMNGSLAQCYGDNIYHRDPETGKWIQEDSFHSREFGELHEENLKTDTGTTDQVLVGDWFVYWGGDGPKVPPDFTHMVQTTQGHRTIKVQAEIDAFVDWVNSVGDEGLSGDPFEWRYRLGFNRRSVA